MVQSVVSTRNRMVGGYRPYLGRRCRWAYEGGLGRVERTSACTCVVGRAPLVWTFFNLNAADFLSRWCRKSTQVGR